MNIVLLCVFLYHYVAGGANGQSFIYSAVFEGLVAGTVSRVRAGIPWTALMHVFWCVGPLLSDTSPLFKPLCVCSVDLFCQFGAHTFLEILMRSSSPQNRKNQVDVVVLGPLVA